MFIVRDGKEIELTADEIGRAYCEHKRNCLKEDIVTVIDENGYDTDVSDDPEAMNTLVDDILTRLDNSSTIFDIYWDTIKDVLDDELL